MTHNGKDIRHKTKDINTKEKPKIGQRQKDIKEDNLS